MKKLMFWIAALMMTPVLAATTTFEEGVHYEEFSEQSSAKPEVKEFFSYYCPACNAIDPVAMSVMKTLPEGTTFKKYHVDFMGAASQEIQQTLTAAMVLAKIQGKGDEVNKAFFRHIHQERKAFAAPEDIRAVAVAAGIDAATYDKNIKNFMVQTQVKLMQKEQKTYSDSRVVNSVPTFIVNGRYKINIAKLDRANQEQDLKALIHYLLTK